MKDKYGKELRVGDEIIFRARIVENSMELGGDLALLKVKWDSEEVPIIDYIRSNQVEKA